MPFIVRQQSAFSKLDEESHRMVTVITEIKAKVVETFEEAKAEFYLGYADSRAESHYAVISEGSRFVKDLRIGSKIKGFMTPGEYRYVD